MLAHRAIPFHDPFSYTALGHSWVPHEWLAEVIFAFVYDRLGWGGVIARRQRRVERHSRC